MTTPFANEYGVELQGARVLVRKFDTTGFSAASGIILQSGTESRQFKDYGQIVLVGPGEKVDGKVEPMPYREGQVVLIRDGYNVESCTIGSEKFYIVMQDSIQAVLHKASFEQVEGQTGKYRIVEQEPAKEIPEDVALHTTPEEVVLTGVSGGHMHLTVKGKAQHLTLASKEDKTITINPDCHPILAGKINGVVLTVFADEEDNVNFALANNRLYLPEELEVCGLADYVGVRGGEELSFDGKTLRDKNGNHLYTF